MKVYCVAAVYNLSDFINFLLKLEISISKFQYDSILFSCQTTKPSVTSLKQKCYMKKKKELQNNPGFVCCCSQFVRGLGSPPPEIDSKDCHRLLRRSVATLCAHSGYDSK